CHHEITAYPKFARARAEIRTTPPHNRAGRAEKRATPPHIRASRARIRAVHFIIARLRTLFAQSGLEIARTRLKIARPYRIFVRDSAPKSRNPINHLSVSDIFPVVIPK